MHRMNWLPHEIYNLPENWKRFIYASMMLVLEEEEKENNKTNKKRNSQSISLGDLEGRKLNG